MATYASTGLRNAMLGSKSFRELMRGATLKIYESTNPPTSADAAVTGTLLATLTNAGNSASVKHKISLTPTISNNGSWCITINGVTMTVSDTGPSASSVLCSKLKDILDVGAGTAITTPAGKILIPDLNTGTVGTATPVYVVTAAAASISVEASAACIPLELSTSITGTGNSLVSTIDQSAAGFTFEVYTDIASGIIEILSTDSWEGTVATAGTAAYARLILPSDTGALSTSEFRLQGTCGTSSSVEFVLSHSNLEVGEPISVSSFSLTLPVS